LEPNFNNYAKFQQKINKKRACKLNSIAQNSYVKIGFKILTTIFAKTASIKKQTYFSLLFSNPMLE